MIATSFKKNNAEENSEEPIRTIYDYLTEGIKHNHDTHNCKSA